MSYLDIEYLETITDYDVPDGFIEPNNEMQQMAIQRALCSSFSLIHGPPGIILLMIFYTSTFRFE
jgi:hypothetical protein